jgi:hypothetical protein
LAARLEAILRGAPRLLRVLETARALALPDWMVFSGAVYQPALNHLTGRAVEHGLKDFDLAYFDAADLSWEAEDAVIRRVAAAFDAELAPLVEVRNQARVHLWFEGRFGEPYAPLSNSSEALARFVSPMFAVAVRLEADDRLTLMAPFGLDDLFALRLRPNPTRPTAGFARAASGLAARWPEVRVEGG